MTGGQRKRTATGDRAMVLACPGSDVPGLG
jgi:hypothetical protein